MNVGCRLATIILSMPLVAFATRAWLAVSVPGLWTPPIGITAVVLPTNSLPDRNETASSPSFNDAGAAVPLLLLILIKLAIKMFPRQELLTYCLNFLLHTYHLKHYIRQYPHLRESLQSHQEAGQT